MSVAILLSAAGLESFIGAFMAEGIETVDDAKLLSDSNLKELGLNMGQRNRFKEQVRQTCGSDAATRHEPTMEEQAKYNEIFDAIDTDGSGEIDPDEFIEALKKLNMYQSDTDAHCLFNEGDTDGGGTLDRQEFITMLHSASLGERGSRLAALTKAGSNALDQLKASSGISFTVEDVLQAPITDEAWNEAQKYGDPSSYSWVPSPSACTDDGNCTLFFNALVVDLEVSKKLVEVACIIMLEDLEEKLRECSIAGFVSQCVNIGGVTNDAIRIFAMIVHRYSHLTMHDKAYLGTSSGMSFIHSFRKAACLFAANQSVQEVRQAAIGLLESHANGNISYSNNYHGGGMQEAFQKGAMTGIGNTIGAEIAGEVLASACNIM